MTPLALSGSDHESSIVVPVIPREVRFSGFVGAVKIKREFLYNKPVGNFSISSSFTMSRRDKELHAGTETRSEKRDEVSASFSQPSVFVFPGSRDGMLNCYFE